MKCWVQQFSASICKTQISNLYTAFRSSCYFLLDEIARVRHFWQMRSTINNINWFSHNLSTVLLMYKMLCRYSSTCKKRAQFSGIQHFLTLTLTWGHRPSELNAEQQEATLSNLPLNVSRNHKQLKVQFPSTVTYWTANKFSNWVKKKKASSMVIIDIVTIKGSLYNLQNCWQLENIKY